MMKNNERNIKMETNHSLVDIQQISNIELDAVNFTNQYNAHHHENNDLEDIDSTDELYDDDLDYKNHRNLSNSGLNSSPGSNLTGLANNAALFIEDDKRKRRAIANSNERRRMQSINAGFQTLKSLIPHSSGEKLSKACILQRSADFMQYLSNEKDKLNTKLQIAIKLIEANSLSQQYQQQINNQIDSNHYTSSNNNSGSFTGTKSSATKINKQSFYLSTLNSQQQNSTADSLKSDDKIQINPKNQLSNVLSTSPNSNVIKTNAPSSPTSTSPQSNRKSTQISSLLNSLNNNSILTTTDQSSITSNDASNCKLSASCKIGTPLLCKSTLGPSSSFTASSSDQKTNSNLVSIINPIDETSTQKCPLNMKSSVDDLRLSGVINTTQCLPVNRQLTDTTNIKPLQPILLTNSTFNQNLIQTNNLVLSNETYSIYDSTNNVLQLNPTCNLDDGLLITTDSIVSTDTLNQNELTNLVLIDNSSNNDFLKILTPINKDDSKHLKNKKKSDPHSNKINRLKQENSFTSIDVLNFLQKSTNDLSSIDSKVSPTSQFDKNKNFKPVILNKLINSNDKTISQFLNSKKSMHSDELLESFNEMDDIYDEEDNRSNSGLKLDHNDSADVNKCKISETIQNLINSQYRPDKNLNIVLKQNDESNINNHFIKTTIIKSSRSNSIDQLIAAAAVTAQSSACMSPLSPSHSPPVSNTVITTTSVGNQSNNLLIINTNEMISNHSEDTSSVSRKNLNTIVEAIFHVEGKTLLDQLDEVPNQDDLVTQSINRQNSQQKKPPKKRKYTTEEIVTTQDIVKDDLAHSIPMKQPSHQFISDYYNNNRTNHYENINKLLSDKSPIKLNDFDSNQLFIINNKKSSQETFDKSNQGNDFNNKCIIEENEASASTVCSSSNESGSTNSSHNDDDKNKSTNLFGVLVNI